VVGDALGPISFRILNASIHSNGLTRNSVNLRSNHFGQNIDTCHSTYRMDRPTTAAVLRYGSASHFSTSSCSNALYSPFSLIKLFSIASE